MNLSKQIDKIDPTFWKRCSKYKMCDIDEEFMGFTEVYEHLSKIIPKKRIIVDLGCAYAPQAVYFRNHKKYIGIDLDSFETPRVNTPNSEHYKMTIREWIEKELPKYNQDDLFAICSYVPPWHDDNEKLVRDNFRHCFVYYPV